MKEQEKEDSEFYLLQKEDIPMEKTYNFDTSWLSRKTIFLQCFKIFLMIRSNFIERKTQKGEEKVEI